MCIRTLIVLARLDTCRLQLQPFLTGKGSHWFMGMTAKCMPCRCYHHLLQHELKQRQQLQHQKHDVPAYSYDQFCRHHQLAYLDYVRFLIGAMWGAVTPESCNELAQDINQGIHKRCAEHLAHMVDKADGLLSKFEEGWLEKRQPRTFAIS